MRPNAFRRVQQWKTMARQWHLVDAARQDADGLGNVIARHLLGKHKPIHEPMSDVGDFVIAYNCRNIAMHAFDWKRREYFFNRGYAKSKQQFPAWEIHETDPCRILYMSIHAAIGTKEDRSAAIERVFLLPDDKVPRKLLENVGNVIEQVQRAPRPYDDYSQAEIDAFPRLVPKMPDNIGL